MMILLLRHLTNLDSKIQSLSEIVKPIFSFEVMGLNYLPGVIKLRVKFSKLSSFQRWNTTPAGNTLPRGEISIWNIFHGHVDERITPGTKEVTYTADSELLKE